MKVETEKISPCKVKLSVKMEAEETRPEYAKVFRIFSNKGRIPGFRPGKAPRAMVQKLFEKEITEEVQGRLVRDNYKKIIEEQKLKYVALTSVSGVVFSPEMGASFVLEVDVEPEFDLPKYKKLSLPFEIEKITDEQVEERIQRQRKAFVKFGDEAAPDYAAAEGDLACVDLVATVDGKPLEEVYPDAKPVGSRQDLWLQLEEGQAPLPEIVEAVKGMKAGEAKEVKVKFPKAFPQEALRGVKAVYGITVKKIRPSVLPTDAELFAQTHSADMDDLRAKTRKAMENAAEMNAKRKREDAAYEALLKKADFEVPESKLNSKTDEVIDRMIRDALYNGVSQDTLKANREAILAQATEVARRQLRIDYVLAAIAREEKIEVSDEAYDAKVAELAKEFSAKPEELKAQLEQSGRRENLLVQIRNEQTMQFIYDQAKVK